MVKFSWLGKRTCHILAAIVLIWIKAGWTAFLMLLIATGFLTSRIPTRQITGTFQPALLPSAGRVKANRSLITTGHPQGSRNLKRGYQAWWVRFTGENANYRQNQLQPQWRATVNNNERQTSLQACLVFQIPGTNCVFAN